MIIAVIALGVLCVFLGGLLIFEKDKNLVEKIEHNKLVISLLEVVKDLNDKIYFKSNNDYLIKKVNEQPVQQPDSGPAEEQVDINKVNPKDVMKSIMEEQNAG